jgi:hypothetical protein
MISTLTKQGWRSWGTDPPPLGILVQVDDLDGIIELFYVNRSMVFCGVLQESFNGFMWRLTGIGRHQLEQWYDWYHLNTIENPPGAGPTVASDGA